MSFDRAQSLGRKVVSSVALAAMLVLSGCQVRPLYDTEGATAARLGSISFSEPRSRVEQVVRNRLVFLTSGGAGEPVNADYTVNLEVSSSSTQVLLIDSSDTPRAMQVTARGTYSITRKSDNQVLKSATRSATAQMDYSIQEFASTRALRDAEDRAAKELAELIRADIAGVLSR